MVWVWNYELYYKLYVGFIWLLNNKLNQSPSKLNSDWSIWYLEILVIMKVSIVKIHHSTYFAIVQYVLLPSDRTVTEAACKRNGREVEGPPGMTMRSKFSLNFIEEAYWRSHGYLECEKFADQLTSSTLVSSTVRHSRLLSVHLTLNP
jgi:hypothetical protein